MILEYREIICRLTDQSDLDAEALLQTEEADVSAEMVRKWVFENASKAQDQEAYEQRYNALRARYEAATQRLKQIEEERRLLYVAVTRAREKLFLYETRERNRKVTRFLVL